MRIASIDAEMRQSYLDYAMSVIVQRALPDARDGFKPVHRRVIYAMSEMNLRSNTRYRKSAGIVGEVLKSYHPHSDTAVYDTLVRMAQDFNLRYPLVDGQGNFGSVDGDEAAAMRYTETRMSAIADEMVVDIDKGTVDYKPNYDASMQEPIVLPSRLPNLLINGSTGIAVGMATNIPPHNLNEICDAVLYVIDNPEATVDELMEFVKGPDFPTGGTILGREGIRSAFATGRGRVVIRAKAFIEEMKGNRWQIIITELPYQVNKANLMERIAELVKDGKLDGISDLRDESDRHRHAGADRAQARRTADEGAEQPLQAHRAAIDLRRQHARPRRTRHATTRARPTPRPAGVHHPPAGSHSPPDRVRS